MISRSLDIKKWAHNSKGRVFKVITDHKALIFLRHCSSAVDRLRTGLLAKVKKLSNLTLTSVILKQFKTQKMMVLIQIRQQIPENTIANVCDNTKKKLCD